jgi:hypothetical protein
LQEKESMENALNMGHEFKKYIIFLLLFIAGCASPTQKLTTTVKYKKDVRFTVNGKKIKGMGVAIPAAEYEIEIEYNFGNMDLLTFSTCHREIQMEGEGSKAKYVFKPTEIEIKGNCPLDIGIYDKKGRHGWGFLLFNNHGFSLPAKVQCNGESYSINGVSACQSQIGTVQSINFSQPVILDSTEGCKAEKNGNSFEYTMASDFCRFGFMDSAGNFHSHESYGYETYIIRE